MNLDLHGKHFDGGVTYAELLAKHRASLVYVRAPLVHVRAEPVHAPAEPVHAPAERVHAPAEPVKTVSFPTREWSCVICRYVNECLRTTCAMCGNDSKADRKNHGPGLKSCLKKKCKKGSNPFEETMWTCSLDKCPGKNSISSDTCCVCNRHSLAEPCDVKRSAQELRYLHEVYWDSISTYWTCGVCTVQNPIGKSNCYLCIAPRPPVRDADWRCTDCKSKNAYSFMHCTTCKSPRIKHDWKCKFCAFRNNYYLPNCRRCNAVGPLR
jgi:hypothetical protein